MAVNPSNYEIEKNDDVRAIVHKWPFAFDLNLNYEEDRKTVFIIRIHTTFFHLSIIE